MAPRAPARVKQFATEAEMCAAFIAALPANWKAWPETCGYDILLVRDDGFQIGVEAKLQLNAKVIAQALDHISDSEWWQDREGVDCGAVLVPENVDRSLGSICRCLRITVIVMKSLQELKYQGRNPRAFDPSLPEIDDDRWGRSNWFEQAPDKRCQLPAYHPDAQAGTPSPLTLTDWKIRAIKIAVILELRGVVTRADFSHIKIDMRRWRDAGWIIPGNGGFIAGAPPDFRAQHPRNYEEIKADAAVWLPPEQGILK